MAVKLPALAATLRDGLVRTAVATVAILIVSPIFYAVVLTIDLFSSDSSALTQSEPGVKTSYALILLSTLGGVLVREILAFIDGNDRGASHGCIFCKQFVILILKVLFSACVVSAVTLSSVYSILKEIDDPLFAGLFCFQNGFLSQSLTSLRRKAET